MRQIISLFLGATVLTIVSVPAALAGTTPPKGPAAPVNSWTGFYVGANVGGGWGNRSVDYTANDRATTNLFAPAANGAPSTTSFNSSNSAAGLGGFQLGYNLQLNRNWLIGVETDFDWSGMKGSGASSGAINSIPPITIPFTETVDEQIKWFGTVRARLGFLPTDNLMTYVTGGFAYGRVERTGSYVSSGFTISPTGGFSAVCGASFGLTCFSGSSSSTSTGWTAGAGFEYAIGGNVSVKAEYLHVSLGSGKSLTETAVATISGGRTPASFNANYSGTSFDVARVGLNYRFGESGAQNAYAMADATPRVVANNWTGWYAGLNGGGAWGRSDANTSTVFAGLGSGFGLFSIPTVAAIAATGPQTINSNGATAGGQLGYNAQFGRIVTGFEADFGYFGLRGSATSSAPYPTAPASSFTINSSLSTDWLATVRPRLGWAADNWLFYVTGGLAVSQVKADFAFSDNLLSASESATISKTKAGWTLGGGIEWMAQGPWTVKLEYLHVDLGSISGTSTNLTAFTPAQSFSPSVFTHSINLRSDIVRAGLNYRFH